MSEGWYLRGIECVYVGLLVCEALQLNVSGNYEDHTLRLRIVKHILSVHQDKPKEGKEEAVCFRCVSVSSSCVAWLTGVDLGWSGVVLSLQARVWLSPGRYGCCLWTLKAGRQTCVYGWRYKFICSSFATVRI